MRSELCASDDVQGCVPWTTVNWLIPTFAGRCCRLPPRGRELPCTCPSAFPV
jgi:hypothetical protein